MSAETAARRTAAAALVADFRAEQARTPVSRPIDSWALRLALTVEQLLAVADDRAAEDGRRLAAIRAVFDVFDWSTDDRQYALEEIERIVLGDDEP